MVDIAAGHIGSRIGRYQSAEGKQAETKFRNYVFVWHFHRDDPPFVNLNKLQVNNTSFLYNNLNTVKITGHHVKYSFDRA